MGLILKHLYLIICLPLLLVSYACTQGASKSTLVLSKSTVATNKAVSANTNNKPNNDEQLFREFLKRFKYAVKQKDKHQLLTLFYFPLQTAPQWTNEDLKSTHIDPGATLIDKNEFFKYFDDIFSRDVIKLISLSGENDLAEIDKSTPENYYRTIKQVTDKGSSLFELQKQYTQDNGKETSFGFVFGKVGGIYKVISYYSTWPLN